LSSLVRRPLSIVCSQQQRDEYECQPQRCTEGESNERQARAPPTCLR
jgi:hypothetical protein